MINRKDNSYRLKTKDGEYLTFKLDMEAMLKLESLLGNSVEATRLFLNLFKPGSNRFYKDGLTILCACCVEKPHLTIKEFNQLFLLNNKTFEMVDEILHNLVTGFFGEVEEEEADEKK